MQQERHLYTESEIRELARKGVGSLRLMPEDIITPLAADVARELGIRVEKLSEAVRSAQADQAKAGGGAAGGCHPTDPSAPRPLVSGDRIRRIDTRGLEMPPFEFEINRPQMDVRGVDVVTSDDGAPMAAGFLSLREGSFPWTLDYDEVQYVLEGELHIGTRDGAVIAHPGDVLFVPKGSSITFGTPSWAKFFYVTFPADWASQAGAPQDQGNGVGNASVVKPETMNTGGSVGMTTAGGRQLGTFGAGPLEWDKAAEFPVQMQGPKPRCVTCGEVPSHKPEHMTQLDAETYAPKNHPRIQLRGRLDSLNALALRCAALAGTCGFTAAADRIGSIAAYCRELMSAEYHRRAPQPLVIAGMDEAALREATHKPRELLGIDHLAPDKSDHVLLLELNYLRCQVREVEVCALDAELGNEMVAGLNRLSSAVYLVELLLARDDLRQGSRR